MSTVITAVICAVAGVACGYLLRLMLARRGVGGAQVRAQEIVNAARKEAEAFVREGKLQIKDEQHRMRVEFDEATKQRRQEIQKEEQWLLQKKDAVDKRVDTIEKKEQHVEEDRKKLGGERDALKREQERIAKLVHEEEAALQRIAGLSRDEAYQRLMTKLERDVEYDAATLIRRKQQEALEEGDRLARDIIAQAIQRCSSEHVSETTVCSVSLPSDDMKGRIIGREGRNIRALEQETGVEDRKSVV